MSQPAAERTMRVNAYAGGGRTRLERRPVPEVGAGDVLLRVRACGLCGTDLFKLANDSVEPGAVLGHEIVADVLETGPGVSAVRPGERVVVPHHVSCGRCALCRRGQPTMCPVFRENLLDPGGFAELLVARSRAVAEALRIVPDPVSDEAAVFLEPAACVLRGIDRAELATEGLAVVVGAGSMGLLHLLVLRAVAPELAVVVVDPVASRRALATELGAVVAAPDGAAETVLSSTDGLGADAVFDTVGGARILASSLRLTRPGGTVVLFAHAPAGQGADFDLNEVFKSERRVVATYSGALEEQARIHRLIVGGELDASRLVTHRLPLEQLDRAVELVRRHEALKVLIVPQEDASEAST